MNTNYSEKLSDIYIITAIGEIFCTKSVAKIDHSSIVQIGGLPCAFMPQDSRENAVLVLTSSHSIRSSY
jgi:hypothetical protein